MEKRCGATCGPLLRISFSNRPKVTFCAFPQTERKVGSATIVVRSSGLYCFQHALHRLLQQTFLPVAKSGRSIKKEGVFHSLANQSFPQKQHLSQKTLQSSMSLWSCQLSYCRRRSWRMYSDCNLGEYLARRRVRVLKSYRSQFPGANVTSAINRGGSITSGH